MQPETAASTLRQQVGGQRAGNETAEPLWNAPVVLALFVLLIAAEWVGRKVQGML